MAAPVTGEAGPCSASSNQPCVRFESRDSLYVREEGWRDSGGDPKAGSATIIPLREDVFPLLVLALPRPSTSQMEAGGRCLTSLCRPHMWHEASGAVCPLPPASSLAREGSLTAATWGLPLARCGLFSCPFFSCPWVIKCKQTRSHLGERIPRDEPVGRFISKPAQFIIQKVATKETRNQERKHRIQN